MVGQAGRAHPPTPQADVDRVCGMTVEPGSAPAHRAPDDTEVFFRSARCAGRFDADPAIRR